MSDETITFTREDLIWKPEAVAEAVFKLEKKWFAHLSRDELHRKLLGRITHLESKYQDERKYRLRLQDAEDKLREYEYSQPHYKEAAFRQTQYIELLESALATISPETLLKIKENFRFPYPKNIQISQEFLLKLLVNKNGNNLSDQGT
jgi:hypothetical protein